MDAPYRHGKPLDEIIPPDYRRAKTAAVVLASMIAGASLWAASGSLLESARHELCPAQSALDLAYERPGRVVPALLRGPSGDVVMPPATRAVVHVWGQACEGCMSSFIAMKNLEAEGGLGVIVPVYNVTLGETDLAWADRYGVSNNLVFDRGGASLVRPLAIDTFTTLVFDANGTVVHRDYPDRPGYRERIRAAVGSPYVTP